VWTIRTNLRGVCMRAWRQAPPTAPFRHGGRYEIPRDQSQPVVCTIRTNLRGLSRIALRQAPPTTPCRQPVVGGRGCHYLVDLHSPTAGQSSDVADRGPRGCSRALRQFLGRARALSHAFRSAVVCCRFVRARHEQLGRFREYAGMRCMLKSQDEMMRVETIGN